MELGRVHVKEDRRMEVMKGGPTPQLRAALRSGTLKGVIPGRRGLMADSESEIRGTNAVCDICMQEELDGC